MCDDGSEVPTDLAFTNDVFKQVRCDWLHMPVFSNVTAQRDELW
jgi:hypothetical protein